MSTYTIVLLDDHALIIEAIKSLLEGSKQFVFQKGFQNAIQLITHFEKEGPTDILLLDIQLKEEDGIDVCKMLSEKYPSLHIIMLSSLTQPAIVLDALKKGAKGFLPKNISLEELTNAFNDVVNGKTHLHPDISLIPSAKKESSYSYVPKITRREKEVLKLILDELTTAEIADQLCLTVSTVETHRASLFSKTGSKNVVGLIKYTLEKGLLDN